MKRMRMLVAGVCLLGFVPGAGVAAGLAQAALAQAAPKASVAEPQLVWIDTDIGDDIDDAFALGLILRSPELKVLGISTAFGDTQVRARLVDRFLAATGNAAIPVTVGVRTKVADGPTQEEYALGSPDIQHSEGVSAMLEAIKAHPGQVTLIGLGPLFNVGAAIEHDPETFRKVKRVVIMGGSIERGYDGRKGEMRPADAEWNILQDPKGAQRLLAVGVPVFMAPLDSTQIHLEAKERDEIFGVGSTLTAQLKMLYGEWVANSGGHSPTPTLFDPLAVAYTFDPELCPMEPMRIEVDDKGFTSKVDGKPNAQVCMKSDEGGFLELLTKRLEAKTQ
ncbi:nucleoside hydrolase [Acidicapsa ligni]|uniref:nucleoside hydrolase n=1 Tax=Acidicapsa ligni TaxID=542300 RepID=UPI0021DFC773|nr:nucleoside hydrolase [Acidicapsa ligni]